MKFYTYFIMLTIAICCNSELQNGNFAVTKNTTNTPSVFATPQVKLKITLRSV